MFVDYKGMALCGLAVPVVHVCLLEAYSYHFIVFV